MWAAVAAALCIGLLHTGARASEGSCDAECSDDASRSAALLMQWHMEGSQLVKIDMSVPPEVVADVEGQRAALEQAALAKRTTPRKTSADGGPSKDGPQKLSLQEALRRQRELQWAISHATAPRRATAAGRRSTNATGTNATTPPHSTSSGSSTSSKSNSSKPHPGSSSGSGKTAGAKADVAVPVVVSKNVSVTGQVSPSATHVAYTADSTVFSALLRSMLSLSRHSTTPGVVIHLLVPPSDAHRADILVQCFQQRLHGAQLAGGVPEVVVAEMWELPIKKLDYTHNGDLRGHMAAFGRLWLQEYLPEVDRVVYLDTDTLIKGDLSPLSGYAMTHPLAADIDVTTIGAMYQEHWPSVTEHLAASTEIFNSGVMVMDLDRWRAENISASLASWVDTIPDAACCGEQLLLNLEFQGKRGGFDALPPEWNIERVDFTGWPNAGWSNQQSPDEAQILHWTGLKPWNTLDKHRWLQRYREFWGPMPNGTEHEGDSCAHFDL